MGILTLILTILNLWKIRSKCDSPDHKAGGWEEEVFIKLTRTVRKAFLASKAECCKDALLPRLLEPRDYKPIRCQEEHM